MRLYFIRISIIAINRKEIDGNYRKWYNKKRHYSVCIVVPGRGHVAGISGKIRKKENYHVHNKCFGFNREYPAC